MTRFILLAAGEGRRLRPLTDKTPKVLTRLGHSDLLQHRLAHFKTHGLLEGVIHVNQRFENLLTQRLKAPFFNDFTLTLSTEKTDTPLGTAAGLSAALATIKGDQPILFSSADIWTDFPLHQLPLEASQSAHILL